MRKKLKLIRYRKKIFTILLEQAYEEIKIICIKFRDSSGAINIEVKPLLGELIRIVEKDIDKINHMDWEV